jgi:hypothetical protein
VNRQRRGKDAYVAIFSFDLHKQSRFAEVIGNAVVVVRWRG